MVLLLVVQEVLLLLLLLLLLLPLLLLLLLPLLLRDLIVLEAIAAMHRSFQPMMQLYFVLHLLQNLQRWLIFLELLPFASLLPRLSQLHLLAQELNH